MFTTRPELRGTFGMVASTHWLASSVGMSMLEQGGNAFDAAAAAGFVLQVVEPHQNGPAGDLPVLLYSAGHDHVRVICGQGTAPAAATRSRFRDLDLDLVPGTGLLAAVVPGAFDGWMSLLEAYGTKPLRDIIAPAIGYARDGYPVAPVMSQYIADVRELFETAWPTSAAVYLKGGRAPRVGELFRNPRLAETLARILAEAEAAGGQREHQIVAARRAFYQGFVAEAIDRFAAGEEILDSSGRRHRGLLTAGDMAAWRATVEEPLSYQYGDYTVFKTGPWGQGPVFLQQLALLKGFDVAGMDPLGADFVHTVVECAKLAFADREAWYGDPDFVDVPMDGLLSDAYNDSRRRLVAERASLELRPGAPDGREARLPTRYGWSPRGGVGLGGRDAAAGVGEPNIATAGEVRSDTVHVDVVDRWGNMVSAMPSGGWLQSSPVIPDLGFCLGTRAQMFWLEEGLPASLEPKKRPRSTLTPGLAFRDGKPYMAFGSPGGDGQDQWALIFFLRVVQGGMNLQQAIDAPTALSFHWPNSFYPREAEPGYLQVEGRFTEATLEALINRGHNIEVVGDWSLGRLAAVAREDGLLKAAANARFMQGYAVGR